MAIEARTFTISLSAATLSYRLTISNTSGMPITGITVSGDLVSAHASLPTDQQIAMAEVALPARHTHDRLMPGESIQLSGELRLPFALIRPIRKGNAAFLVPLARLRVESAGGVVLPILRTTLVGIRPAQPGGVLQPFRLDLGPRIYREVTQKIFS